VDTLLADDPPDAEPLLDELQAAARVATRVADRAAKTMRLARRARG
jgi:hypothetical protein